MQTCLLLLSLSLTLLAPPSFPPRATLTLDERVQAREAIARVQYGHQLQATQPFEQAVPRAALEREVRDMLAQSVVMEERWGIRITADRLQAESARMTAATRLPERLRELRAALGGDEVLFQETVVRPLLVARLFQERFDHDAAIQAGALDGAHPVTWEQWSARQPDRLDLSPALEVIARPGTGAPALRAAGVSPAAGTLLASPGVPHAACTLGEVWDNGILSQRGPVDGAHAAIWTGSVYLVVGGHSWARYDPALDAWIPTSSSGAPEGDKPTVVWAGSEAIAYGGQVSPVPPYPPRQLGGRYNPVTNTWIPFSYSEISRTGHSAVWTGSRMIVWGGQCSPGAASICPTPGFYGDGLSYDPATDTWTPLPDAGLLPRALHSAVWTGSRMIVWGGYGSGEEGVGNLTWGDGAEYDPASSSWTLILDSSVPQQRREHRAMWDGTGMIVDGGNTFTFAFNPITGAYTAYFEERNSVARLDAATGLWVSLGDTPYYARGDRAVWTGQWLLTYGAGQSGGRLDLATDTWYPITFNGAPYPRYEAAVAWDGEGMFVHGGQDIQGLNDGGRYVPDPLLDRDGDGDGFSLCGGDCDDGRAEVNPYASESCNGLDDDCDGHVDDGEPGGGVACGNDAGQCSAGLTSCVAGRVECVGEVGPGPEVCNGLDDDCDNAVPASEADADGDGYRACAGDCDDSRAGANPGASESCNGLDDDCDGQVDDGGPGAGVACGSEAGQCSAGLTSCVAGRIECMGEVGPAPEACNGLDDDCDDVVPASEADADGDGYRACAGDCDDSQAGSHPGAVDLPGNTADENCDGMAVCSPAASWPNRGALLLCVMNECKRLVHEGQVPAALCRDLIKHVK